MSISSANSSISYVGNNSTSTPYVVNYPFFDASDLKVYYVDVAGVSTLLTLTTNYTVSGGNGSTGSVVTTAAIPATSTVIITRSVPYTQLTSLTTGDRLPAASLEKALDKVTMQTQQLSRNAIPDTASTSGSAPYVLGVSTAGGTPSWVSQSSAGIADGSLTPAKLSTGKPTWDTSGNVTATSFNGAVVGNVTGNVTGNLTGNVVGNVTGNLTGTASAIPDLVVSTAKMQDLAVTTAKMAANSVTAVKLGANEQKQICKAWVNFTGVNTLVSGTYTGGNTGYLQTGTSVTVYGNNFQSIGFIVGQGINFNPTSGAGVLGSYIVTAVTTTSMTFTVGTSQSTLGNYTLTGQMIRSSHNVSSITKNGTGDYTVNFATPMADANYSVAGMTINVNALSVQISGAYNVGATLKTTNAIRVNCAQGSSLFDCAEVSVQIFGN